MKSQTIKTRTNEGHTVHVKVKILDSDRLNFESAVIIDTIRLIPIRDVKSYQNINLHFPTFFILRETKNYIVYINRSTSFKLSTFEKINEIVNRLK